MSPFGDPSHIYCIIAGHHINKQTWCSALKRWRVVCVSFKNQVPFLWAPPFLPPLLSGLEDLSNDCTYAPWWQLGCRKYIYDITTSTTSWFILWTYRRSKNLLLTSPFLSTAQYFVILLPWACFLPRRLARYVSVESGKTTFQEIKMAKTWL